MKHAPQVLPETAVTDYFGHPWHQEIAAYRLPDKDNLEVCNAVLTAAEFVNLEAGKGGVYRENGRLLESSRHRRRSKDFTAGNETLLDQDRIGLISRKLPGKWVYLGWYFNHYGHFLLESLARSWFLLDQGETDVRGYLFHLHARDGRPNGRNMEVLELLGLHREEVAFIDRDLRVERLVVPTQLMVLSRAMHDSMHAVYRRIATRAQALAKKERYPGKIYVSRRLLPEGQRKAVNEDFVEACFRGQGYEIVHPQFLPFTEQVNLFFAARDISGFEGSGLHNVLFSREGTRMQILGALDRIPDCITQEVLNAFAGCQTFVRMEAPRAIPWLKSTTLAFVASSRLLKVLCNSTDLKQGSCNWLYRFRLLSSIAASLKQKNIADPAKIGEIVCSLNLTDLEEIVLLALIALTKDDAEQALKIAAGSSDDDSETPLLLYLLARVHKQRGDMAEAEAYLCSVLAAGGRDHPEVHSELAQVFAATGKYVQALEEARKAIRMDPDDTAGHLNLGLILLQQGENESALSAFTDALEINPYAPVIHNRRAQTLSRMKRFDEAVSELERALELAPGNRHFRQLMTGFLLQSGRDKEAEQSAREDLKIAEKDPIPHSHLSQAMAAQGRLHEALEEINRAIELEPERAFFHRYQSSLYRRLGNQARAQESLKKAHELTGG